MNKKHILILLIIMTAVAGSALGFFVAQKYIQIKKENLQTQIVDNIQQKNINDLQNLKNIEIIKQEPEKKTPALKKTFSCPKPTKKYEDETYLNLSQTVALPDPSYIPSDLEQLSTDTSTLDICLKTEAKDALEDMLKDAQKARYVIKVSSGFRDYDTQKIIYDANLKTNKLDSSLSVAKPGYSEHQLGVAVDLTSKSIAYASASGKFENTDESKWLEAHAEEYGFIQSYPKGKEDITGYMYEPWHYRYVGIDNAAAIIKSGQTINQFLSDKIELENTTNKTNLKT